jgi:Family of unknown function (DUF6082)
MNERAHLRRSVPARIGLVALCALAMILVATLIGIASVGLAAVFTGAGKPTGWEQINEAFGVVNSVFSALALIVVGLTLWVQYRELKMQRRELNEQRLRADRSTDALQKTAEADFRALHVALLRMAIDDPALAEVWPSYVDDVTPDQTRQFLYASLVLQHQALVAYRSMRDPEYVRNIVRFCFSNPIVRDFWGRTMANRRRIGASDERVITFEQTCNAVYVETREQDRA